MCYTHCLSVYRLDDSPSIWEVPIWHQSPGVAFLSFLNALANPQAAVVLFFILSGYVLTLSIDRTGGLNVAGAATFYLRRALRILPMMWAALTFTYALAQLNYSAPAEYMSDWYVSEFERPLALSDLLRNFALLDFKVSPVTWTMRIELLGSLLMPLSARIVFRAGKGSKLIVLMLLFAVVGATRSDFRYLVCFYVGSLLTTLDLRRFEKRSIALFSAGLAICALLRLSLIETAHSGLSVLIGTVGATLLLAGVLASPPQFAALEGTVARRVGRLSYSLYLLHPAILGLTAIAAVAINLYPRLPAWIASLALFIISTLAALALAAYSHRYIELPSIAAGKRLLARDRV